MTLTVLSDQHLFRALEPDERHLLLKLTAPKARRRRGEKAPARPAINVCFVLDRSGSMAGEKIALARYAVERALQGLTPRDRFSVVVYDDQIDLLVGSQTATKDAKHKARVRLQAVDPRGSTDLHGGWAKGAEAVKHRLDADGINRVLLLTDGLANHGETSPEALTAFAADLRASGVPTSTFGVGADFDEALLQAIADAGGGHFYYIEHPNQIPDYITSELGELLETVARGVEIDVKHAAALEIEPLSPIVAKAAVPGELKILVGDLVAGQDVELVLRVVFPPAAAVGVRASAFFTVSDRDQVLKADGASIDWESADAAAVAAEKPNAEVLKAVARLNAAAARQEAVRQNRAGNYGAAMQMLHVAHQSVQSFAVGRRIHARSGRGASRRVRDAELAHHRGEPQVGPLPRRECRPVSRRGGPCSPQPAPGPRGRTDR